MKMFETLIWTIIGIGVSEGRKSYSYSKTVRWDAVTNIRTR